ncbi:hypothetical protein C1645_826065 [Glomus cerebriforme]|uniref:Uncharacterized protein n=1 Tax=Glomus cerebriforme TaxID=658196 RepID=A0A397SR57_9GLOM|nr:hypothetical protein C1645_826065 [Glomus cerebriforme]
MENRNSPNSSLHLTKDYLSIIQLIIDILELCTYLEKNILIAPMDYPGQKNVHHAVDIKHIIVKTFKTSLHIFNDYYVKNFHSSIQHQTNSFNTTQQIIHQANEKCPYCYKYLCNGIKDNCMTFQNMLNKKFDDDKESSEDLEDQMNLQDDNNDEIVSADKDINRKLEEVLELFNLYQ